MAGKQIKGIQLKIKTGVVLYITVLRVCSKPFFPPNRRIKRCRIAPPKNSPIIKVRGVPATRNGNKKNPNGFVMASVKLQEWRRNPATTRSEDEERIQDEKNPEVKTSVTKGLLPKLPEGFFRAEEDSCCLGNNRGHAG